MGKNKEFTEAQMAFAGKMGDIVKAAFYAGIKCTHSGFNGEIPYIEKEHLEDISCSDQIDEDPAVNELYEQFLAAEIIPFL